MPGVTERTPHCMQIAVITERVLFVYEPLCISLQSCCVQQLLFNVHGAQTRYRSNCSVRTCTSCPTALTITPKGPTLAEQRSERTATTAAAVAQALAVAAEHSLTRTTASLHSEGTDSSAVDTAADSYTELSHKQRVTTSSTPDTGATASSIRSTAHVTSASSNSTSAATAASAAQLVLDSQAEAALSAQAALLLAAQERRRASVQAAIDELDAILLDGEPRPVAKCCSSQKHKLRLGRCTSSFELCWRAAQSCLRSLEIARADCCYLRPETPSQHQAHYR
eukprot:17840-Heterococcus_DN1.PRE.3